MYQCNDPSPDLSLLAERLGLPEDRVYRDYVLHRRDSAEFRLWGMGLTVLLGLVVYAVAGVLVSLPVGVLLGVVAGVTVWTGVSSLRGVYLSYKYPELALLPAWAQNS